MDYLLFHADNPSVSGDSDSLTWSDLAMHYASEIQTELRQKPFSQDAIISTFRHYAHYMRFANVNRRIYANAPELCLIACSYSLNIAVYQFDHRSSQQYVLIQEIVGDPMLPTAPLCPFFFLRFEHFLSSLQVIFLVKKSSLQVSEQPFFDILMSQFNLVPMLLWHGAASPLYMPPPSSSN